MIIICLPCVYVCCLYPIHTAMIMHALDMKRVSVLIITLTSTKVEIFDVEFDLEGSVVKKRRNILKTVLFLFKCVLDVAMSIAASIIVSLLLLSGDIEQNPGPLGGKGDMGRRGNDRLSCSVG